MVNLDRRMGMVLFVLAMCGLTPAQEEVEKAKKAHAAGEFDRVVALLDELYPKLSGNAEAVWLLADATVQTGAFDRALTYAVKAVDLDPKSFAANRTAAMAFFGRAEEAKTGPGATQTKIEGFYEEALSFADAATRLKADDAEMWAVKGEVAFQLSQGPVSAAAYEKAAALVPDNVDFLYYAARGHALAGKNAEAVALMTKATAAKPDEGWLWRELGTMLAKGGDADAATKAAEAFGKAIAAKNFDDVTRRDAPVGIMNALGATNPAKARELVEPWTKLRPSDPFGWWWVGHFAAAAKDDATAIEAYTKSFEVSNGRQADAALFVGDAIARQANAGGRIDMDKLNLAAQWATKAAKVRDYSWDGAGARPAWSILGYAFPLVNAGRNEDAGLYLEKYALPLAPEDHAVLNSLGLVWRDAGGRAGGRSSKSVEAWTKSRDYYVKASSLVVKDDAATGTTKAQILNDTGLMFHYHFDDIAKGVEYYRKALSFDAGYIDALENMGLCLDRLGKHEEAISYFERVLKDQPNRFVSVRGLEKAKASLKK